MQNELDGYNSMEAQRDDDGQEERKEQSPMPETLSSVPVTPCGEDAQAPGDGNEKEEESSPEEGSPDADQGKELVRTELSPDERGDAEQDSPLSEEEEAETPTADDSSLAGVTGGGVLVNITMNTSGWSLDAETGKYTRAISSSYITNSTALYVTGVNRQALNAHIYWHAENGLIAFETAAVPGGTVTINGVLSDTGDEWTAAGVIECWPGAGLVSKRFRQALNAANWSVSLAARGNEGDTKTILTGVGFANAQLLFATPEWTGNTHVVIPSVWVHDDYQRLCYTLTNLSDEQVTITEVALRLLYSGTVSNLTEEAEDSAALSGYISEIDIDELE